MNLSNASTESTGQTPESTPRRKGRKGLFFGFAAILLAAACVIAFALPKEEQAAAASTYKESAVTRGDITAGISETGTISIDYTTVKYEISSTKMDDLGLSVSAEEVYVKSGQRVAEGDPLIRISTTDLQEQLDSAKLSLQQAQASLTQAKLDQTLKKLEAEATYATNQILAESADATYQNTLESLENSIESLDNDTYVLRKKIRFAKDCYSNGESDISNPFDSADQAEIINNMNETAFNSFLTSLNDQLNEASNKLAAARLSLETQQAQAKTQLESDTFTSENAKTLYDVTLAQISNSLTSAELKVESAQNDVNQFTKYLASDGIIASPVVGTVMTLGYAAGDDLSSSKAIAVISNPAKAYISVSIVQEDITALELGQAASVTLDAFPDEVFTAALDSMSVSPSRSGGSTVSYTVDSLFNSPSDKFFEGMTGDVTFITKQLKDVLMVTNRAITNTNGVQTVKVKGADGTPETRKITTGFSDGRNVEVQSGLEEGETVLIESQVAGK